MTQNQERLRILLIEHNRVLLEGLCRLLSESSDTEVAGVAGSGAAGLALFQQLRPSAVVIDLDLADISAVELVRLLQQAGRHIPILILATYQLDPAGAGAIASGAAAVVAKDQIASVLLPLICTLCRR